MFDEANIKNKSKRRGRNGSAERPNVDILIDGILRKMLPLSMSHAVILPESALLSRACFNFFLTHGNKMNGKEKLTGRASESSVSHKIEWSMIKITGLFPGPTPQTVGKTSRISVGNRQRLFPTSRDLEQSSGSSEKSFGRSGKSSGSSEKSFGRSRKSSGSSEKSFGRSRKSSGSSEKSSGRSRKSSGRSEKSFGRSRKSSGSSEKSFGRSRKSSGRSEKSFGSSEKSSGRSEKSFGRSRKSSGRSEKSFGSSEKSSGRSEKSFGRSRKSSGRSEKSFGRQKKSFRGFGETFPVRNETIKTNIYLKGDYHAVCKFKS